MVLEEFQNTIFEVTTLDESDEDSKARLGRFSIRERNLIETPNFLAVTSRGVVPHITPDVILEHTSFGGVHMALEDCKFENSILNLIPCLRY